MGDVTILRPTDSTFGHYIPGVKIPKDKEIIFTSGVLPVKADDTLVPAGNPKEAVLTALNNALKVVEDGGGTKKDFFYVFVLLQNLKHSAEANAAFQEFFADHKTCRAMFSIAGVPKDVDVELIVLAATD